MIACYLAGDSSKHVNCAVKTVVHDSLLSGGGIKRELRRQDGGP